MDVCASTDLQRTAIDQNIISDADSQRRASNEHMKHLYSDRVEVVRNQVEVA